MAIDSWDEVRTAWHVAHAGTVSGAAEALGVHHATVIRHIDALEKRLGVKLFQRHPRGYTPTEAGEALAQVGKATEEQFAQLGTRLSGAGSGISGDLVISTLSGVAQLIRPALNRLIDDHPDLVLRIRTDRRIARLEYGEAHLAVRAGSRPTEPDNLVRELIRCHPEIYASQSYLDKYGVPQSDADMAAHRFVSVESTDPSPPHVRWLHDLQPTPRIVIRSDQPEVHHAAMVEGVAMGFLFGDIDTRDLVRVMPSRPEWAFSVWLVTHVDMHRSAKVQAALAAIRETITG